MSHTLSIGNAQLFGNARANFTRWRWHALVLSLVIIGAGMATVVTKASRLDIDFSAARWRSWNSHRTA